MLRGPGAARPASSRERRWPAVVGACAGLLVLPLTGWLLLAPPSASPRGKAAEPAPEAADTEASDEPAPPERAPQPGQRAAAAATAATAQEKGVEGEVVGPDGDPVAEAGVRCTIGDRELEATTDRAGRFRFAASAAGCTAVAKKRGFAPSPEMTMSAGVRLQLAPAAGIAGVVVEADGAPVVTYMLGVDSFEPLGGAPDAGGRALLPSVTIDDAEGAFTLEDLAPGRYVLAATAAHRTIARTAPIELRAGAVTKGVRIALKRGRTVAGTVVDARTKQPLVGALVFAETDPEGHLRSVPSLAAPPDGRFTLEGSCPETCAIYAWSLGYTKSKLAGLQVPATGELRVEIALRRLGDAPP